MGKSPGKWIKTLILGKKSSKSNIPKGREVPKTKNRGEILVSSNLPVSDLTVDTPLASPPLVATDVNDKVGSENIVASNLPNDGIVLSAAKDDGPTQAIIKTASSEDPEKFRLEEAVITVQAAFRGYASRREFQTIKCIIRLQSIVRGNLVRRQAVSTLSCVQGIVKFQALVRGHKGVKFSTQVETQSKNAFVQKLLASLPSTIHLRLQYDPEDPNSASQWLERWTLSRLWKPLSQHEGNLDTKSCGKHGTFHKGETDQGKSKRRVQRLSGANGENGSAGSLVSSEKRKGNLRKPSSQPEVSAGEHQQNDVKVKSNLRKASASTKEVPALSENENGNPKDRKTSRSATPDVMEQGTSGVSKKPKDKTVTSLKKSDQKGMEIPSEDQVEKLSTNPVTGTHPLESDVTNEDIERMNPELNLRDDCITNGENQQASQRRASLPAKLNCQENAVHNSPKLPSYMAPTESVKARQRGQGSPRFAKEVVEKNGLARRHSLSSSTNSLLSSLSPRAHRLVRTTGKGMIKSDISLTSSRDGGDKVIQPEWRR